MFPASATNNVIQVKRSLSKPQPPGWSRGRMDGEGLLGVQLRRTECEHMFSALPLKLGHCSTQSACLKGAKIGRTRIEQMCSAVHPITDIGGATLPTANPAASRIFSNSMPIGTTRTSAKISSFMHNYECCIIV
jgi:hypothetical protein